MGIFATARAASARPIPRRAAALSPDGQRQGLPPRFEAVGEALASGSGSADACAVVGRDLARDGASLEEALDGLRTTSGACAAATRRTTRTWRCSSPGARPTLGYLHQLSCEDPLTGLASLPTCGAGSPSSTAGTVRATVRARTLRPGRRATGRSTARRRRGRDGPPARPPLRLARLGEAARTVFAGGETVGRLGPDRVVVLAAPRRAARAAGRAAARGWSPASPATCRGSGSRACPTPTPPPRAPRRARPRLTPRRAAAPRH